ncbi:unnamed protein product, partial [Mesorhabditis belari]|uniref:Neurotransmitter-gated ion-channel ligand-binding domain-containing protein n=1 Tax=Mesorhabditis belari TaxID=2138241 RepID=A0AAF3J867_9BILA
MFFLIFVLQFCRLILAEFDFVQYGETEEFSNYMNNASLILKELFITREYEKELAPIFVPMPVNFSNSETKRMRVDLLLSYVRVFNLDAEKQRFNTRLEIEMSWRDPRLVWDKADFGGVDSIVTTAEKLWIPDTVVSNARVLDEVSGIAAQGAQIYSNGSIFLTTAYYSETACSINANKFPFDKQNCSLPILSLSMQPQWISLWPRVLPDLENNFEGNGEWEVIAAIPVTYSITAKQPLEVVAFMITIKREPNFYVYLAIGLTSLVSMTVLLDMLADAIPKTRVFPLLGIYVVVCVAITSVACISQPISGQESEI